MPKHEDAEKNRKRILEDISQFHENIKQLQCTQNEKPVIEMAERYIRDANFFLEKNDLITAFGCANYAHGLIDALRALRSSKKEG